MAYSYGTVTNCKVRNGQTRSEYECRIGYEVVSQSISNNTSEIRLRLECRSTSSSYTTKGSSGLTSYIDGTKVKDNAAVDMSSTNTWQNFGERTITVTHNSDGTYSSSKSGSFTCSTGSSSYSLSSGSANVTVNPPTIPRYATITKFNITGKTLTSISAEWATDAYCDRIDYSLNNGSWVNFSSSGTFTVTGLTPNTSYSLKIRVRRQDSQLWTESGYVYETTYDIGKITSAPNINFGDNATITKSNPSSSFNRIRLETLNPTTTIASRDNVPDTYTLILNDSEWDTLYRKLGDSNSITIRYVVDTEYNGSSYHNGVDRTLTLTGNQKTVHVGVGGEKKRAKAFVGVNGTVKRAVIWVGNNGRKRCI